MILEDDNYGTAKTPNLSQVNPIADETDHDHDFRSGKGMTSHTQVKLTPHHSRNPSSKSSGLMADESSFDHASLRHVPGSMQISDTGDVWNLFFDDIKKELYLKAGIKIFKPKCIPEEIRAMVENDTPERR
jgi:hypothetical protein